MPGAPSGRLEQTANARVLDCKHPALSGVPIRRTHGDGGRVSSRQVRGWNTSEHAIYRGRGVLGDDYRMVRLLHFRDVGFHPDPAVLQTDGGSGSQLPRVPRHVRERIRGSALRSHRLRTNWGPGGAEVRIPLDRDDYGTRYRSEEHT